jgi:hypothetical protein
MRKWWWTRVFAVKKIGEISKALWIRLFTTIKRDGSASATQGCSHHRRENTKVEVSEVRVLPNHPSQGWQWLIIHDLLKSVVTWGCPSVTSPQIINNLATLWLWLPFILGPGWGHLRTWFAKPQGILMTPSSSPKLWWTAWTKQKCKCSKSVLIWPVLLNLCSSEYRYRNHQKTWKTKNTKY